MKPTPTEAAALAAARPLREIPAEEFHRLATHPALASFEWRHIRARLAADRLKVAAQEWEDRERQNSRYQDALRRRGTRRERADDRWTISHDRVTALDRPTQRIRDELVYRFRQWQEADAAAWRLF